VAINSPRAGQLPYDPAPIDWYDEAEHRRKLSEAINRIDATLRNGPPRAMVKLTANESITINTPTYVPWDDVTYDLIGPNVNNVWWNASNSTRLTVPAKQGIRRIKICINIMWAANNTGDRAMNVDKNGSSFPGSPYIRIPGIGGAQMNMCSGPLEVEDDDYFELNVFQSGANPLNLVGNNYTWMTIEAV